MPMRQKRDSPAFRILLWRKAGSRFRFFFRLLVDLVHHDQRDRDCIAHHRFIGVVSQ